MRCLTTLAAAGSRRSLYARHSTPHEASAAAGYVSTKLSLPSRAAGAPHTSSAQRRCSSAHRIATEPSGGRQRTDAGRDRTSTGAVRFVAATSSAVTPGPSRPMMGERRAIAIAPIAESRRVIDQTSRHRCGCRLAVLARTRRADRCRSRRRIGAPDAWLVGRSREQAAHPPLGPRRLIGRRSQLLGR
jgi:hypothetical protein